MYPMFTFLFYHFLLYFLQYITILMYPMCTFLFYHFLLYFLQYITILMYLMCAFLFYHFLLHFIIIHCYSYVSYVYLSILSLLIAFYYNTLLFLGTLCVHFYSITFRIFFYNTLLFLCILCVPFYSITSY